jgi:hypothetical protein
MPRPTLLTFQNICMYTLSIYRSSRQIEKGWLGTPDCLEGIVLLSTCSLLDNQVYLATYLYLALILAPYDLVP